MTDDLNPELAVSLADVEARIDAFIVEFEGAMIIHPACTPEGDRHYCVEFHEQVDTPIGFVELEYVTAWYTSQTRAVYDAFLMWKGEINPTFIRPLDV